MCIRYSINFCCNHDTLVTPILSCDEATYGGNCDTTQILTKRLPRCEKCLQTLAAEMGKRAKEMDKGANEMEKGANEMEKRAKRVERMAEGMRLDRAGMAHTTTKKVKSKGEEGAEDVKQDDW